MANRQFPGNGPPTQVPRNGPFSFMSEGVARDARAPNVGQKKDRSGCWWCLSSHELKGKDGWFKSPRDTTWTIDSTIDGKKKPSGYDSNSLITILRSSQCVSAVMVLILYIFTLSSPALWITLLAAAVAVLSGAWSILVLFLRHHWTVFLVIPEFILTIAWMVTLGVSYNATPPEGKYTTYRLALVAIEASMVLWIQTCLLGVTPLFHKLMPWLFQRRSHGDDPATSGGLEMVSYLGVSLLTICAVVPADTN
ncbi:hypothetical protein F4677DRAFT_5396 [Hypoxylon crocopeplum]|nr:hypothetical protein F4677DRAFT_5396 [Hypoxylon crocopeplum]